MGRKDGLPPKADTTPDPLSWDNLYYAYKVEWRPGGTYIIIIEGTYAEALMHASMEAEHMHQAAAATDRGQDAMGTAMMTNISMLSRTNPMEWAVDLYGYTVGVTRHRQHIDHIGR